LIAVARASASPNWLLPLPCALDRFARWSDARAALQAATLITVAIAAGIGVAA